MRKIQELTLNPNPDPDPNPNPNPLTLTPTLTLTCPMRFIARNTQEHSLMITRPMTPKIPAIVRIPIVGIAIAGIAADHCMHT